MALRSQSPTFEDATGLGEEHVRRLHRDDVLVIAVFTWSVPALLAVKAAALSEPAHRRDWLLAIRLLVLLASCPHLRSLSDPPCVPARPCLILA